MIVNLNKTTLLFLLIILLVFLFIPINVAIIGLFTEVVIFSIYTLRRMNRKDWDNPAITKQERGRAVYIIAIYSALYVFVMFYWFQQNSAEINEFDNVLLATVGYIQGIMLNYLIFQVNIELNHYGNTGYQDEGLWTRIIKGRDYQQSNSRGTKT
jgi:hypothetical protein